MRKILLLVVGFLVLVAFFLYRGCHSGKAVPLTSAPLVEVPSPTLIPMSAEIHVSTAEAVSVVPKPTPRPAVTPAVKKESPPKITAPVVPALMAPPPVEIHKELIPKDIAIVRVYYENDLMGPGQASEFDINGTGFTPEFERMISVVSGHANVRVENMTYVTKNQLHGRLVAASTAPTSVGFPQILINNKVVFRAPEPFGIIRPGEILTVLFTEMGESGRSGRFQVYTNLTPEMFQYFTIESTTPTIQISDLSPRLPFIVNATINIGPALVGDYGMRMKLNDKVIWDRPGVIRIVQPAADEAGLVQRIRPVDEFLRPGDDGKFVVQGSGFQPADVSRLGVSVTGFSLLISSWTYVAPGRMDLVTHIPENAAPGVYAIRILQKDRVLLEVPGIFSVVPKNWLRQVRLDPPLFPGGESVLYLDGRDFDKAFIEKMTIGSDEEGIAIGKVSFESSSRAKASVKVQATVLSGDYLLAIKSGAETVKAAHGNVINVGRK